MLRVPFFCPLHCIRVSRWWIATEFLYSLKVSKSFILRSSWASCRPIFVAWLTLWPLHHYSLYRYMFPQFREARKSPRTHLKRSHSDWDILCQICFRPLEGFKRLTNMENTLLLVYQSGRGPKLGDENLVNGPVRRSPYIHKAVPSILSMFHINFAGSTHSILRAYCLLFSVFWNTAFPEHLSCYSNHILVGCALPMLFILAISWGVHTEQAVLKAVQSPSQFYSSYSKSIVI